MAKGSKKKAAKAAETKNGGDVIDRSKYTYETSEIKTADGKKKKVRDNGDRVAEAIRGMDADAVVKALKANGGKVNDAWSKLNAGMRRMAAGNALRALVRAGTTVEIGGKRVASLGSK